MNKITRRKVLSGAGAVIGNSTIASISSIKDREQSNIDQSISPYNVQIVNRITSSIPDDWAIQNHTRCPVPVSAPPFRSVRMNSDYNNLEISDTGGMIIGHSNIYRSNDYIITGVNDFNEVNKFAHVTDAPPTPSLDYKISRERVQSGFEQDSSLTIEVENQEPNISVLNSTTEISVNSDGHETVDLFDRNVQLQIRKVTNERKEINGVPEWRHPYHVKKKEMTAEVTTKALVTTTEENLIPFR